jgi:hypothetical protein
LFAVKAVEVPQFAQCTILIGKNQTIPVLLDSSPDQSVPVLEDIAAKRIDTVVAYKVDRLTRSLADFAKIVEQFDKQGISFVSVGVAEKIDVATVDPMNLVDIIVPVKRQSAISGRIVSYRGEESESETSPQMVQDAP